MSTSPYASKSAFQSTRGPQLRSPTRQRSAVHVHPTLSSLANVDQSVSVHGHGHIASETSTNTIIPLSSVSWSTSSSPSHRRKFSTRGSLPPTKDITSNDQDVNNQRDSDLAVEDQPTQLAQLPVPAEKYKHRETPACVVLSLGNACNRLHDDEQQYEAEDDIESSTVTSLIATSPTAASASACLSPTTLASRSRCTAPNGTLSPTSQSSTPTSVTESTHTGSSSSRTAHHVWKTILWVSIAVIISILIGFVRERDTALEFMAAYLVEYSLSVDNLFVFLLIFRFFHVPSDAQETVLSYGIVGAMVLRGVMIVAGKSLVNRFEWVGLLFAALLIYSAGKLLFENDDDDEELDNNLVIRFARSLLPVTNRYMGDRFFVRGENARLIATPLMVVLVSIELSDIVFAVDSVPAVLGLSKDMFVIYTSNILAIVGLRSLFFVLSSSIGNLRFLKQALAIILGFIGIKMIAGCYGYDFSTTFALLFVVVTLVIGVLISLAFPGPGVPVTPDANSSSASNNV